MVTFQGSMAKSVKEGRERYVIVATTKAEDRDGDIVEPKGAGDLGAYRKNPVILFAHRRDLPPIGKATGFEVGEEDVRLEMEFAKTPFAQEIKYLYDEGYMNTFSIGFIPKEWEPRNGGMGRHFKVWDLFEVSAVPVPANAEATMVRELATVGKALVEYPKLAMSEPEKKADNPIAKPASEGEKVDPMVRKVRMLADRVK